jgi:hypothetical protein
MSKTNDERAHDLWIRTLGNEIQSPLPVSEALDAAESRGFERGRAEERGKADPLLREALTLLASDSAWWVPRDLLQRIAAHLDAKEKT